ncbi:hypothetical protein P389DRAFT_46206 [Cystobasidium minutum MCA 4210]|uniref:uncharacterized protein n=1 Tax=Cystobasidium minutum MCA 4210 TaxID=1397322 RepID=UPI0034CE74F7|eukprot:jgi/Rhomi1/46206/CE46205_139
MDTLKSLFPFLNTLETNFYAALADFRVKVGLRVLYILLSSYGTYAIIREHPTPIFRGWTAFFIVLFYIVNALLALAISDREIKITWLFLRSFSTWRFFYAFYSIYPQHFLRLAAILGGSVFYAYLNRENGGLDRKAYTALCLSLFLVASDTPRLRKIFWTGENAKMAQIILGVVSVALLVGWQFYRWLALLLLYFTNDALLMASFVLANTGDRLQLWSIAASTPCLLVYHFASQRGLISYFAIVYAVVQLFIVRPNSPTPDILAVRTSFTCAIAILLEVFVHGITGVFAVLTISTLLYVTLT